MANPVVLSNVYATNAAPGVKRPVPTAKGPAYRDKHESEQAGALGPNMGTIAQADGMRNLEEISRTGYSGLDRMAQNRSMQMANRNAQSQQAGIAQQSQMRGQRNAPSAFAAAQSTQQGGANRSAAIGSQLESAAVGRKAQANQALAQGASSMQQSAMQRAGAADAFAQWQAGNYADRTQADFAYERDKDDLARAGKNSTWDAVASAFGGG